MKLNLTIDFDNKQITYEDMVFSYCEEFGYTIAGNINKWQTELSKSEEQHINALLSKLFS